jgi:hypothetical protein
LNDNTIFVNNPELTQVLTIQISRYLQVAFRNYSWYIETENK